MYLIEEKCLYFQSLKNNMYVFNQREMFIFPFFKKKPALRFMTLRKLCAIGKRKEICSHLDMWYPCFGAPLRSILCWLTQAQSVEI